MPAYSPDYNPIEMLWKKVKEKGVHLRFFATFESLVEVVDKQLASLAQDRDEVLALFGAPFKKGSGWVTNDAPRRLQA